jgi:hypothetical protein
MLLEQEIIKEMAKIATRDNTIRLMVKGIYGLKIKSVNLRGK